MPSRAAFLVLSFLLAGCAKAQSEPSYKGRTLSEWAERTNYTPVVSLDMHGNAGYQERQEAFEALVALGDASVPTLCKILSDRTAKWSRRDSALQSVGRIGPAARASLPTLVQELDDPTISPMLRYEVPQAINAVGGAALCVPQLVDWLRRYGLSESELNNQSLMLELTSVLKALKGAGAKASSAVPTIIEIARFQRQHMDAGDHNFPARRDAVDTLAELAPHDAKVVAFFDECEKDPHPAVREAAARALK